MPSFRRCIDEREAAQRKAVEPTSFLRVWVIEAVPQHAQALLRHLARALPPDTATEHIRRVQRDGDRRVWIFVAPVSSDVPDPGATDEGRSTETWLWQTPEWRMEWTVPHSLHIRRVPAHAPLTRAQMLHWSRQHWPVAYRPTAPEPAELTPAEERYALTCLSWLERQIHRMKRGTVIPDDLEEEEEKDAALLARTTITASATADGKGDRPPGVICYALGAHAPMRCIDAASQRFLAHSETDTACTHNEYMLTGLDMYTVREPCVGCAMALTHSRIRRVFFIRRDLQFGGIGRVGVHRLRALNHRYEAFQRVDAE
ncbi:hypothetical protein CDCA_CDCA14G3836 [Cyanidium caldarium]|uniref:CMP/dCMP-type deaminase domain-containing protein n=1 Tax=Cyanidium caldarium TaxID=2771 RepID=A0AAV9J089_CYACA|nr:hypothetical protein CDCA_CDCA14G3836 [Cyanidium caldarium]